MATGRLTRLLVAVLLAGGGCRAVAAPAPADSVDIVEEILSRGIAAESDADAIADELSPWNRTVGSPVDRRAGRGLKIEAVAGARERYGVDGGRKVFGSVCRFGLRRDDGWYGGFADVSGAGPLKKLVIGGVRPTFGEGLLLGVRKSPYRSPGAGCSDPGVVVTGTSSVWGARNGAAISVGSSSVTASAVAWEETDTSRVYWASVGASGVGIAAGTRQYTGGRPPGFIGASLFATHSLPGVTVSGECAGLCGRLFALVRARCRAAGLWNAEFFDSPVPRGYSGGTVAPGDEHREQRGCALHRTGDWRGIGTRISLYANTRRTATTALYARRICASLRGRSGAAGRWSASLRWSDELETEYAEKGIDYRSTADRRRRLAVRADWTGSGASVLRQRYRVSVGIDGDGSASLVAVMGWRIAVRCVEAGFQASNYSMAAGRTGYVARPGFSGGEAISAVTRTGSDVSADVGLDVRGVRGALHWTRPWDRPPRVYASVRISL